MLFSFDVKDVPTAVQTNGQNMRGWFSNVNDVTTCAIEAPPLNPLRRLTPIGFYIDPMHADGAGLWRSGQCLKQQGPYRARLIGAVALYLLSLQHAASLCLSAADGVHQKKEPNA